MPNGNAQKTWEAVLGEIQVQVSRSNYRTWFERTVGLSYENGRFVVGVPNTFVAEYLDRNQRSLVEKALIGLTEQDVQVVFQVNGKAQPAQRSEALASPLSLQLNPRYSFDNFVEGSCNRLARAAALAVTQKPGAAYNPLFIYSGSGLGKTHLLHAIGHAALKNNVSVVSVSGEQFTNEFVNAIRERRTEEFRARFRNAGMLLVDDVNFISGKEQTEESFFHTFDELHNTNRQIVLTSDQPPQSSNFKDKLRSRFEWGLSVNIQAPDFETRLAILQSKARQGEISINEDIIEFIGKQIQNNIRELEGSLNRVIAYAKLLKALPSLEMAARAMEGLATKAQRSDTAPNHIIGLVAEAFNLTPEDLIGPRRDKEAVMARRVAMFFLRQETTCSLAQIGRELGGRDAAAVTNACKRATLDIKSSPLMGHKATAIKERLHPGSPAR